MANNAYLDEDNNVSDHLEMSILEASNMTEARSDNYLLKKNTQIYKSIKVSQVDSDETRLDHDSYISILKHLVLKLPLLNDFEVSLNDPGSLDQLEGAMSAIHSTAYTGNFRFVGSKDRYTKRDILEARECKFIHNNLDMLENMTIKNCKLDIYNEGKITT